MGRPKCPICDDDLSFRWTDTHGIGACLTCNTPVRIYHYEGEGDDRHHVEKPPGFIILEEWIPVLRKYWQETKSRAPNGCNFPGSSYEPCGYEEFERWNKWCEEHDDELPKEKTDAEEADQVSA
jgi:hypothetical protein